jgi:hypothetical protein
MALIPEIFTEIGGRSAVLKSRLDVIRAAHLTEQQRVS